MKDFRVRVQIRNNLIIERREQHGLSPRQLADAAKVRYPLLLSYEALKTSPLSRRADSFGHWKISARRISDYLGVSPEELWPDSILAVKTASLEIKADSHEIAGMAEPPALPDECLASEQLARNIRACMGRLTERERSVIEMRYGFDGRAEMAYKDIGNRLGVSLERIRQIECKALRKIRHPSVARLVKDWMPT